MKSSRLPLYLWLAALPLFIASIWFPAQNLPEKMETRFDEAGVATEWMTRNFHIGSFLAFGLGMSAFIIGLCFAIRYLPAGKLNVPNREFWRKPANHPIGCDFIFFHAFWLGIVAFIFIATTHFFVVSSAAQEDLAFSTRGIQGSAGVFIVATIAWCFFLVRFFQKVPGSALKSRPQKAASRA